ncbi:hypothetical protein AWC38_SpisGene20814 [Stylophora pistillata]|uniref:Uncharacterized protein n=1 Tax=Stylophora pistillata TaxID=50429 RepID=A0A2B4RFE9_STYPI|nr:hypothetical protein AWC38_SpisGene20814 [Stylophora pistillata]
MEAVMKSEVDERGSLIGKEGLPDEIDKNYVLQNYLKTQASSVTNVDNLTVETNVESVDGPLGESSSNNGIPVVKNEPAATSSKINPADEAISLPKQEPATPTPKPLNPLAPEFEGSLFRRYDPRYTADYELYKHQEAKTSDSPRKPTVEDPLIRLADILSQRRLQDNLPLPEISRRSLARFGTLPDAYRKKINEWPKIPPNDGTSLHKFSDFLIHCQTATNTVKYLKVLDDPDENQKMVRKLPRYLVDRWSREVDRWLNKDEAQPHSEIMSSDIRKGEVGYPPFSVFCRFLQRESRIACNPVTTARLQKEEVVKEDLDEGWKSNGLNRRRPLTFNVLATESHEVTDSNTDSRKEKESGTTPNWSVSKPTITPGTRYDEQPHRSSVQIPSRSNSFYV